MSYVITRQCFEQALEQRYACPALKVPYDVLNMLWHDPISSNGKTFLDCRVRMLRPDEWICHLTFNTADAGYAFGCIGHSAIAALTLAIQVFNADEELREVLIELPTTQANT